MARGSPRFHRPYRGRSRIEHPRSASYFRRPRGRLEVGLLAGHSDPRLAEAINALHGDPSHGWTLEELAALAGMSRARSAARFRVVLGVTPMAFLTESRIGVAQAMLGQGKSVQLVADRVGYSNASALSRVFATQTGTSPREWLKQNAESSQR